ncbi:PTS mannose transporter subunit IIA [uncultured Fusobacterium sp.]|uniref:PTS sugar transporter subunit IIA n=1 Tax=uncultured Fusobacterium sp. TaxID=159267 RepID=UPI0025E198FA|nr:PTS mannose transporter subunit IIA [uncultured Fusobacterium sp.]
MKFVIATHGTFADGIRESIKLIAGEFKNLKSLSCYTREDFNLKEEINKILNEGKDEEIIVVTDIFGGSVNNAFLERIPENKNLYVISGLNLPLMLELLGEYEEYRDAESLIRASILNTNDSVHFCNQEINQNINDEEF